MRNLQIVTIPCGTLDTPDLIETIKDHLRQKKKYRADLMYRGVATDEEGLRVIQMYGTDRGPNTVERARMGRIISRLEEHEYELDSRIEDIGECEHNTTYLLPESKLEECITIYSESEDPQITPFSLILVYHPDRVVCADEGNINFGKAASEIPPKKLGDGTVEFFRFKDNTPRKAFVAGFRLEY